MSLGSWSDAVTPKYVSYRLKFRSDSGEEHKNDAQSDLQHRREWALLQRAPSAASGN
jgi:hypothetical protein